MTYYARQPNQLGGFLIQAVLWKAPQRRDKSRTNLDAGVAPGLPQQSGRSVIAFLPQPQSLAGRPVPFEVSMTVGSVVFGPVSDPNTYQYWKNQLGSVTINAGKFAHACNCIGAQPGETKCPCSLRGEAEQGRKMISDGVIINGKRYKLVEA
jgi:hypothetical protein